MGVAMRHSSCSRRRSCSLTDLLHLTYQVCVHLFCCSDPSHCVLDVRGVWNVDASICCSCFACTYMHAFVSSYGDWDIPWDFVDCFCNHLLNVIASCSSLLYYLDWLWTVLGEKEWRSAWTALADQAQRQQQSIEGETPKKYQNPPDLIACFSSPLKLPLKYQLQLPIRTLQTWVQRVHHQIKVSIYERTHMLKQHQDIWSWFTKEQSGCPLSCNWTVFPSLVAHGSKW